MAQKYLKDLFDIVKKCGKFPQYADYNDYRQKNWGQTENKREKFLEWLNELPPNERTQFLYIFGED